MAGKRKKGYKSIKGYKGIKGKIKGTKRVHISRVTLQQVFSIFLIICGLVVISFAVFKNFDLGLTNKQETPQSGASQVQEIVQKPQYSKIKSINIPKIKRNLTVSDGQFSNNRWEVAPEGVSFYTQSMLPEKGGNTVLYGHNKARILGGLVDMRAGDQIEMTLENGKIFKYEVFQTKTIKPTDVSILSTSTDTILTIYTCSGFLDTSRFVVLAKQVVE